MTTTSITMTSKTTTSKTTMQPLWFCLDFPRLPVEIFVRHQEKYQQDQPVVVICKQRIVQTNQLASEQGIQIGSSMNTAYTISDHIVSFERDETRELANLQQLAQWAMQFTPDVTIRPPSSLLLNVAGCLKLFDGKDNLKQKISEDIADLGFEVHIGINGTPLSALCFAKAGAHDNTGDVRPSLERLPLQYLQIEPEVFESLRQMGISTCGQLLNLPADGLNRRFGVFFTDYLQRLTGERPDPQSVIDEKPRFRSDITFMSDVDNMQSLVFPMKRLLQELEAFLRGRQLMVSQFSFRISHRYASRHGGNRTFTVFLTEPDNDARMFLMLSQLQLEKSECLPEVDNLSLAANHFYETETRAGDLFEGTRFKRNDGSMHSKHEEVRAVRLINMMTARLGHRACFGLSLADDHRPERAWRPISLSQRDTTQAENEITNVRPVYLLAEPKRLAMQGGEPSFSEKEAGKLECLLGPERIDAGWWDDQAVARDYYIARHPSGALYWIFRDLNDHVWHLHGIFS